MCWLSVTMWGGLSELHKWLVCVSVLLMSWATVGLPTPPQPLHPSNAVGSSPTVVDKDCRIRLLPQIQGCTLSFLQHYQAYQTLHNNGKQKSHTGNLCHSYGETLQCLHLAFLQCKPTGVHLDLMEAQLPHPDLMQTLCFTPAHKDETSHRDESFSEAEPALGEETASPSAPTVTAAHTTEAHQPHTDTRTLNKGQRIKIVVSQKLYQDSELSSSIERNTLSGKPGKSQLQVKPSQGHQEWNNSPHGAPSDGHHVISEKIPCKGSADCKPGSNSAVLVDKLEAPQGPLSYESGEQDLSQLTSNHVQRAPLTGPTDSAAAEYRRTDCDRQTASPPDTHAHCNTATHLLPAHKYYMLPLCTLVFLIYA